MPSVARTLLLCCGNHTRHINRLRGRQNVGFYNVKVGGTYSKQIGFEGLITIIVRCAVAGAGEELVISCFQPLSVRTAEGQITRRCHLAVLSYKRSVRKCLCGRYNCGAQTNTYQNDGPQYTKIAVL